MNRVKRFPFGRSDMSQPKCPVCGQAIAATGECRPFCGPRCRNADLAKWFNEEYSVPVETERALQESLGGFSGVDAENSGGSTT
jgi:hypothetical protein